VRFWDASAVLPLIAEEAGTDLVRTWLSEDTTMLLWGLTRVELSSAIERRHREGRLSSTERRIALQRTKRLCDDAIEVTDLLAVRLRAATLLIHHPLRAADACQLAAALLVAESSPTAVLSMVVLDHRLAEAADREGLDVKTWP
jgi:hypothetical protein